MSLSHPVAARQRLPATYVRGIRKKNHIFEHNGVEYPRGEAFEPDLRTHTGRQDGWAETSINWEDDEGSLFHALKQPNYYRVARMPVSDLDYLIKNRKIASKSFRYERQPLEGNPYHGNLLFDVMPREARNMITNAIAIGFLKILSRSSL